MIFVALALVHFMPGGYGRAVVAVPIALSVPGVSTLCLLLGRRRVDAAAFTILSALLSVVWLCFASLILYVLHVLITGTSTYLCLLVICAALTVGAQVRLARSEVGSEDQATDLPIFTMEADRFRSFKSLGYTVAALVAGIVLLSGSAYVYEHGSHPGTIRLHVDGLVGEADNRNHRSWAFRYNAPIPDSAPRSNRRGIPAHSYLDGKRYVTHARQTRHRSIGPREEGGWSTRHSGAAWWLCLSHRRYS